MLTAILARFLSVRAARIIAGLLPFVAAALAVWWVMNLQNRLARAEALAKETAVSLQVERQARARDVAGLSVLAQGTAAASVTTKKEAAILGSVIDAKNPQPVSRGLSDLLHCLAEADAGRECAATAGTGGPAAR